METSRTAADRPPLSSAVPRQYVNEISNQHEPQTSVILNRIDGYHEHHTGTKTEWQEVSY